MLRVASDFTQLALHALAHLPLTGPERLHDPAYLAWSATNLPEGARSPIERDAETLAELCGRTPAAASLQEAPELFEDIAQLRACAARKLEQLTDEDVAAPSLLSIYRSSSTQAAERWRAAVALAAPAFAAVWHEELLPRCIDALDGVRQPLDEARRLHSGLAEARVELAWPLGQRSRASERRIVVGVPDDWGGLTPATPAVAALHEAAVRAHGHRLAADAHERHVRAQWAALVDVCERVRSASIELREAHFGWLAARRMESLCREAAERGLVTPETAARIAERPERRAELLLD